MDPDCDYLACSSPKNKTHENIKEQNIREITEGTDQIVERDDDRLPIETHQTVKENAYNIPTSLDERKHDCGTNSQTCSPAHQYLTLIKGIRLYTSNYNI